MSVFTVDIIENLKGAKKIAIAGHIRPDGDCIGSCTALYQYLMQFSKVLDNPQIDIYLETFGQEFNILTGTKIIRHNYDNDEKYDVFISLDCSSLDRIGNAIPYFETAKKTICIDHHITNDNYADVNHVEPNASSTCEVLFNMMDEDKITKEIAECLYVGIVHDTGIFKHSSTSDKTMEIAAKLIRKGINFTKLIEETFIQKTYNQLQILGRCLMESFRVLDGKVIISHVDRRILDFYQASHGDLDGIIDHLRTAKGTEVAVFIYETGTNEHKISLRSNNLIDVSKIARYFGGGGHVKAAGCTMVGTVHDVINNLTPHIKAQLMGKE
ncbi:MAG: bifunctional oligoribonuclease/PAP phosphatase NrnA [Clostridiales bacterium]|nr:bifunctional oligoribonuclease/PAP phosphatase NrnA [Clostridiales bacterium]